jgi:hypothetical protein
MNHEPIFNLNGDTDNTDGYRSEGYGGGQPISGAGNNPWQTDQFSDGYQENIFEQNFGDSPYTESAANPNPLLKGYHRSGYQYKPSHELPSLELEL